MAVAKSYQKLEIVKTPYMANGKMYVQVKLGNGNTKQVRWYSDKEYAKYYPGEKADHSSLKSYKSEKDALGFQKGFVTLFIGETFDCKDELKEWGCRWNKTFHAWYLPSENEAPEVLPEGVKAVVLPWELVGIGDSLKKETDVKSAVENLIYEPDSSEFQGELGERVEVILTVEKSIGLDGYYGHSTMHIMRDENGNAYVWTTGAKCWEVGSVKRVRGTIKDHRTYRNVKQTVLTRCAEVKEK